MNKLTQYAYRWIGGGRMIVRKYKGGVFYKFIYLNHTVSPKWWKVIGKLRISPYITERKKHEDYTKAEKGFWKR